ncbi:hypothetical protein MBAV_003329 [Candidatus Magnetobacterium bavaricum]|uniref:Uncharacterized protein n=1 Tax=Candidatus Magnetobacterium bavaricum TaxID=29290 RepID=A0A0F3GRE4_9BACT|nr:hypothetical protein MBAV_003329 [Candidatus Magnetobacterium bavaricum]
MANNPATTRQRARSPAWALPSAPGQRATGSVRTTWFLGVVRACGRPSSSVSKRAWRGRSCVPMPRPRTPR